MQDLLYKLEYYSALGACLTVLFPLLGAYLAKKNSSDAFSVELKYITVVFILMVLFQAALLMQTFNIAFRSMSIWLVASSWAIFTAMISILLIIWIDKLILPLIVLTAFISFSPWVESYYIMKYADPIRTPHISIIICALYLFVLSLSLEIKDSKFIKKYTLSNEFFRLGILLYSVFVIVGYGILQTELEYLGRFVHVFGTVIVNIIYFRGYQCLYKSSGLYS